MRRVVDRALAIAGVIVVGLTVCLGSASASVAAASSAQRLVSPTALAIGPNGNLYVVDTRRDEVLERLPDGRFVVVAGDGRAGFSGDGGPATAAGLRNPGGIAFGPGGGLYIADTGNNRVREVLPNGTIRTVVGDGSSGWVPSGTAARSATLAGPVAVSFGPNGHLYIADGDEVLRLGANSRLDRIAGIRGPFGGGVSGLGGPAVDAAVGSPSGLAVAGSGTIYVCGFAVKTLDAISRGVLRQIAAHFYCRDTGDLSRAPNGVVYAAEGLTVVRLDPQGPVTVLNFFKRPVPGFGGFLTQGVAVNRQGDIFVDTAAGNGFALRTGLIEVFPDGKVRVLWRS